MSRPTEEDPKGDPNAETLLVDSHPSAVVGRQFRASIGTPGPPDTVSRLY